MRDYIYIRLYVIITAKPASHVKSKCEKNFIVFLHYLKLLIYPTYIGVKTASITAVMR